jgi:hypothetical protein
VKLTEFKKPNITYFCPYMGSRSKMIKITIIMGVDHKGDIVEG